MGRIGGIIQLQVNGEMQDAKGAFTYGIGKPKRETVAGQDRPHGYKETPTVAFIEGTITDRSTLDLAALATGKGLTITLELANGKIVTLADAYFAGEPNPNTEEGEIPVRWESTQEGEEV
jgi:hypothetical protein